MPFFHRTNPENARERIRLIKEHRATLELRLSPPQECTRVHFVYGMFRSPEPGTMFAAHTIAR